MVLFGERQIFVPTTTVSLTQQVVVRGLLIQLSFGRQGNINAHWSSSVQRHYCRPLA